MATRQLEAPLDFLQGWPGWSARLGPELGGPPPPMDVALIDIRETRFAGGLRCARCRSPRVQRWGTFSGRQRYRCRSCRRTFSDLTGTPLMYSKLPELWGPYMNCMAESLTVRAAGARLGIDKDTAWRWRHRILEGELRVRPRPLRGIVEAREARLHKRTVIRSSGTWWDGRPARRDPQPMWLLVARDRRGNTGVTVAGSRRPTMDAFRALFGPRPVIGRIVLQNVGRFGAGARYARVSGSDVLQVPTQPAPGGSSLLHLGNVTAYQLRLRAWLGRFHGVAVEYLPRYLRWHALLDEQRAWPSRLLLDPLRPPIRPRKKDPRAPLRQTNVPNSSGGQA